MIIGKIVTDLEEPFDILLVKCRRPFRNMGGEYHDDILGITITEPFLKNMLIEHFKCGQKVVVKGRLEGCSYNACKMVAERIISMEGDD
jgi:hypothetical protein